MGGAVKTVSNILTPKNLATGAGALIGGALAAPTGGLSIPVGAAIGGSLGRVGGTAIEGGDTEDYLKSAAIGAGAGYAGGTGYEALGSMGTTTGAGFAAADPMVGALPIGAAGAGTTPSIFSGATPYVLGASMLGSQYMASEEEKKMAERMYSQQKGDIGEAQTRATDVWKETAFPQEALLESKKLASTSEINQRAIAAQKAFMDSMAARGISGGGMVTQGLAEIERGKQQQLARMASELTQFGLTPNQASPILTAYPQMQPYTPFASSVANTAQQLTGTLGGMYAYDWLRGR